MKKKKTKNNKPKDIFEKNNNIKYLDKISLKNDSIYILLERKPKIKENQEPRKEKEEYLIEDESL